VNGEAQAGGGVPHGATLIRLAEAVVEGTDTTDARAAVRDALGDAALVDAAAVVALFNAIDRVADATGIPLEPAKAEATADFRPALRIGKFLQAD
jgi:alkylhydroperoxidase family enzyme